LASDTLDDFRLESIAELHAVSVGLFVPFVIHRLARVDAPAEADLRVSLRGMGDSDEADRHLRLNWEAKSVLQLPPGVPEATITEWAALGIACAVVWHYRGLRLSAVSLDGDRFDYWVQREGQPWGLEVSGTG
jgi:hypothetical protein